MIKYLGLLFLGSCTTIAAIDAKITNTALGIYSAPSWCVADDIPYVIKHTNVLGTSKACGLPASECVVQFEDGSFLVYLPDPSLVPGFLYREAKEHAECHVHLMHKYGDSSHRQFR